MSISALINKEELKTAQQLINKTNVPSPPNLLIELKQELSHPEPDIHKINNLILEDIGLTAKILKTINSPAFGLNNEIHSLEQAINLMGLTKLKDFIIKPAYRHALEQSFEGFELILENAHMTGSMADLISKEVITEQLGEAYYLSGLFHNVGSLIMGQHFDDYMAEHEKHLKSPISWPVIELEKYGIRHMAISVLLAKHWGLPNTVCNAIYLHHDLVPTFKQSVDQESITMASVLSLSNFLILNKKSRLITETSLECNMIFESVNNELMLSEDILKGIEQDAKSVY